MAAIVVFYTLSTALIIVSGYNWYLNRKMKKYVKEIQKEFEEDLKNKNLLND